MRFRPLILLALVACHHHRPVPASPAAALLGTWQYQGAPRADTAPTLNAGLRFALTFDSATGRTAFGHVSQWFAGDVGARPGTFGPVVATVDSTGGVTLVIPYAKSGPEPMYFAVRLLGDTLAIAPGSSLQTTAGAKFVRARP